MRKTLTVRVILVFALFATSFLIAEPASSEEAAENSWLSKTPMNQARGSLGVAAVEGKIYAIGGSTIGGIGPLAYSGFVGTNEQYDPATDSWSFKAPMPTPRGSFAIAVHQGKIYCIGGFANGTATRINEAYDPATNTWETKKPMPTARWLMQANTVGGKIYLIDGSDGGSASVNKNEVYDPATDSWTTKTPMPNWSNVYVSAVVDDKIYVISRWTQIYDPEADSWSQGEPPPSMVLQGAGGATTRALAPVSVCVFAVNGSIGYGGAPPCLTQVYDPENDSWAAGASIPTNRINMGAAVINDTFYVIGGNTHKAYGVIAPSATNEVYMPIGYGTVTPRVVVVSPENVSYTSSSIPLTFLVDEQFAWAGYSLDGAENVTVDGNATLTGLSNGLHSVVVYVNGTFGNMGASEPADFTVAVAEQEPFPVVPVAVVIVAAAVIGASLFNYFRKRKPEAKQE